LKDIVVEPWKY